MKKIYILILFNAVMQFAAAQPTITTLPQIGDVVTSEYAYTTGILPGASGANITWDYSNLMDSATVGTVNFVSVSSTPYATDFPGADIAANLGDTLFSYYQMVSGTPGALGVESASDKFVYAHPFSTLQYPFTYPDSFYDSVTMYLIKPFVGSTKFLDTTFVTGYGTLKLPGQNYNNVLQVMEISASSGSIIIGGITYPVPPTLDTIYDYYVNGQPGPILFYNIKNGVINLIDYLKSSTVLPLRIISFTATPGHGDVELNWQTGYESNTDVFNIQRSTDGSVFNDIGKVAAIGNGSHNYSYIDAAPPIIPMLYYRLQETDRDGRSIYSNIVICNMPGSAGTRLFPNPASTNITITGIGNYSYLKIFNLSGQQLNNYSIKGESITVPVAALPSGVYIAELSNGTNTTQVRFLKK